MFEFSFWRLCKDGKLFECRRRCALDTISAAAAEDFRRKCKWIVTGLLLFFVPEDLMF